MAIPVAMDAAMPSMCTVICAFVLSSADIIDKRGAKNGRNEQNRSRIS
jgi:hypothetical protein